MIGLFSDSQGDLEAFDRAYELLRSKGAKRFFFLGNRYADLEEWITLRKSRDRGASDYSNQDFLSDISNWLSAKDQIERPAAFGLEPESTLQGPDWAKVKAQFLRAPERGCLQYADPSGQKKGVDMIGDHLCTIVHDKNDLDKDDLLNAGLFIHGKEPEPKVVQIGARYFITPGKLSGAGEPACAALEIVERVIRFSAFALDGRALVSDQPLAMGGSKTKLSVK